MKKIIKRISFAMVVVALVLVTGLIIKTGKFEKLEGYMYSLAMDINSSATDTNATSCDATSSNATSCDATSSNATSSNATSCNATSSNATSSNVTTATVEVTNTPINTNTQNDANKIEKEDNTEKVEEYDDSKNILGNNLIEEKEQVVSIEEDNEVTFLESQKMYIIIIGMSILAIIIVTIIIIVDKKAIAKRKAKANNENKID